MIFTLRTSFLQNPKNFHTRGYPTLLTSNCDFPYCAVPPENCDVAQRNFCATFAFSCKRAIFATERNFRATLAHFGLFLAVFFHFGNILGQNGKWNLSAPTIFPTFVAVCLKIATSWPPTFFTQCHWASVARLTKRCSVACSIGSHFCEQRLLPKIGLHLTFALH